MLTAQQRQIFIEKIRQLIATKGSDVVKSNLVAAMLGTIVEMDDKKAIVLTNGETDEIAANCLLFTAVTLNLPLVFHSLYSAAGGTRLLQDSSLCHTLLNLMLNANKFFTDLDGVGFGPKGPLSQISRIVGNCTWYTLIKNAIDANLKAELINAYSRMSELGISS